MTKHNPCGSLQDMADYAALIARLVAGRTLDDLHSDVALRLALERAIEVIGEAASRLSGEFRARHANIEWAKIIGMRNVLAHGYDVVLDEVLWDTGTLHVPQLLAQVQTLLRDIRAEEI